MSAQIYIGAVILIEKDGMFLFGKRKNMFGEGSWGLPGGQVDVGESIHDAAKRELREETGLIEADLELVVTANQPSQPGSGRHYIQFVFCAKSYQGVPENCEPDYCEGWEWFAPDNLPKEIFVPHKI